MFLPSCKVFLFSEETHFNSKIQKQPSISVLIRRSSENMQQLYRRTPMPKCNFNKVAKQLSFCWARFFNIKQSYSIVLITIIGLSNSRHFPVFGSHTWIYQPYMGIYQRHTGIYQPYMRIYQQYRARCRPDRSPAFCVSYTVFFVTPCIC